MFGWKCSLVLLLRLVECSDWNSLIEWEACNHRTSLARSIKHAASSAACKLYPTTQSALESLASSLSLSFDQLGLMAAASLCGDLAHNAENDSLKDYFEKLAGFYVAIATNSMRPSTEIFRILAMAYETPFEASFGSRWHGYRTLLALVAVSHHPEVPAVVKHLAMKVFLKLLSPPLVHECDVAQEYSDLVVRLVPSERIPDYPSVATDLDRMNSRILLCVSDEI